MSGRVITVCVLTWLFVAATITCAAAAFPVATSKKGLQVQMLDDGLALGIQHATLNVNLSSFIDPRADKSTPQRIAWQHGGHQYFFHRRAVEHLNHQIKSLSDEGVLVYLILLVYEHHDDRVNQILSHPNYNRAAPNHLAAFNSITPEGRNWLSALISCFAHRWSIADVQQAPHGRVVGYIVGNEVNSHWFWSNQGEVTMEAFAHDYHDSVRLIHSAVRSAAEWPRVYISLEHHWNIRYPGGSEKQAFGGRTFIDHFAELAKQNGDFDWQVAFHPYPENLFDPRFWLDTSAVDDFETPRITFRNIDVLTRYLQQPALQFNGNTRRVILSEQGFHTPDGPDGEQIQAAAYCLAWKIVNRVDGIDAFILHRHVDHRDEGGLRLGLWTRQPDSAATAAGKKQIYDCFRDADTDRWRATFEFALPIIGMDDWDE
jgi:hypothetical protein